MEGKLKSLYISKSIDPVDAQLIIIQLVRIHNWDKAPAEVKGRLSDVIDSLKELTVSLQNHDLKTKSYEALNRAIMNADFEQKKKEKSMALRRGM